MSTGKDGKASGRCERGDGEKEGSKRKEYPK